MKTDIMISVNSVRSNYPDFNPCHGGSVVPHARKGHGAWPGVELEYHPQPYSRGSNEFSESRHTV